MKALITGSNGFVAKNLIAHLREIKGIKLYLFSKSESLTVLETYLKEADFIFHLAGVNRPKKINEYISGNRDLTNTIVTLLKKNKKKSPILFSSSVQVSLDNEYGKSKKEAEKIIQNYSKDTGANHYIYRLPNIFGKWSRPNYNSVIATWCYNIANDKAIKVTNNDIKLNLVYIDDVIDSFIKKMNIESGNKKSKNKQFYEVNTVYNKTLGEIKELLDCFKKNRDSLLIPDVGSGFERILYATYLSFLRTDNFSYDIKGNEDERGTFYEIIKTLDSGQFSLSTTAPGVTRGNHYHHTKNEKFLVVKGEAVLEYRDILTDNKVTYNVSDKKMEVIEMIPGYTHKITNVGNKDMILFLWANEIYDKKNPDTYFLEV